MRRLYFDIETSPCLGWFWRPSYNMSLDYNNVLEDAKIICICYKWDSSDKVYHLTWDSKQCDKKMLKDFVKIMNQADEIVGHNSDKFDTKWIRTRCLFHNIPALPDYASLDTLKLARGKFLFPSNRLDSIGRYTGVGKKIKTTGELWFDVWRKNSRSALKEMVDYCKQDVILLQQVYDKLHPYVLQKHRSSEDVSCCPKCESQDLIISNRRLMASGTVQIQLRCKDCGAMSKSTEKKFLRLRKEKEKLTKQLIKDLQKYAR